MHTDHVVLTADTDEEALRELGTYAIKHGHADETYVDALLEREVSYPTGLSIPNTNFGLAIPHADPDNVEEQAVVIGFPEETISFRSMDDPEMRVEVEVVVLLLVTDTEGYTTFLSNLAKLFQGDEFVRLVREQDGKALLDLITDRCLGSD